MSNSSINTLWTQGMTNEEKDNFTSLLLNNHSNTILKRLKKIIEIKKQNYLNSERAIEIYSEPNWAFRQAHINGTIQSMKIFEDLLNFVDNNQ